MSALVQGVEVQSTRHSQWKLATDMSHLVTELKACKASRNIHKGRLLHSQALNSGHETNIYVATTLVSMYTKCGCLTDATRVFQTIPPHHVVAWNALILGYAENGEPDLALHLFSAMQREFGCLPNDRSFVAVLVACNTLAVEEGGGKVAWSALEKTMAVHAQASRAGCTGDVFVVNSLIDTYGKCGSMEDARLIFERSWRVLNLVSWNALVLGYAENGEELLALELFYKMRHKPDALSYVAMLKACESLAVKEEGQEAEELDGKLVKVKSLELGMALHAQAIKTGCETHKLVGNTLLDLYSKCGSLRDARRAFDRIQTHGRPDLVLWNTLLMAYAENGAAEQALELFRHLNRHVISVQPQGPSSNYARSFVGALKACGSLAEIRATKSVHGDVYRVGLEGNEIVSCCLVDAYCRCGSMRNGQVVFDSLRRRDSVTWTSLIAGYSRQGDTELVFEMLGGMEEDGARPNEVTLVCILTACSHAGLVDKGKELFRLMSEKYGVSPGVEHYLCMIDLLERANQVELARELKLKLVKLKVILNYFVI